MVDTKERILLTALRLFAKDGYEAVPVSAISGALGMTKGALYKHYKNKRDIFDSILKRMEQRDQALGAEEAPLRAEKDSGGPPLRRIAEYGRAQVRYWTENPFAAPFRRMLMLEQYRSEEMSRLYQHYLVAGPVEHMEKLLGTLHISAPREKAVAFYAPLFLLYSLYDGAADKATVRAMCDSALDNIVKTVFGAAA